MVRMRPVAATILESTLSRGTTLEQFIGDARDDGNKLIRWIELVPKAAGIEVWDYSVADFDEECLAVPDSPEVEQKPVAVVADPQQALEFARSRLGTRHDRWVNQGMSPGEFIDRLHVGRAFAW